MKRLEEIGCLKMSEDVLDWDVKVLNGLLKVICDNSEVLSPESKNALMLAYDELKMCYRTLDSCDRYFT